MKTIKFITQGKKLFFSEADCVSEQVFEASVERQHPGHSILTAGLRDAVLSMLQHGNVVGEDLIKQTETPDGCRSFLGGIHGGSIKALKSADGTWTPFGEASDELVLDLGIKVAQVLLSENMEEGWVEISPRLQFSDQALSQ
jgi:hypothetical protein